MPNNFTKEKDINASGWHLFVVYKPEYAIHRKTNPNGVRYFHCFVKKGKHDLQGLIQRIVINQSHEYVKALLFNKQTNKCESKWTTGAIAASKEEIEIYNNRFVKK